MAGCQQWGATITVPPSKTNTPPPEPAHTKYSGLTDQEVEGKYTTYVAAKEELNNTLHKLKTTASHEVTEQAELTKEIARLTEAKSKIGPEIEEEMEKRDNAKKQTEGGKKLAELEKKYRELKKLTPQNPGEARKQGKSWRGRLVKSGH